MSEERLTILVVHGRDFKPGLDDFASLSFDAMRAGLARDYPDSLAAFDVIERDCRWAVSDFHVTDARIVRSGDFLGRVRASSNRPFHVRLS